jgi:hypothetical protein
VSGISTEAYAKSMMGDQKDTVSVIIPALTAAEFLAEVLDSVVHKRTTLLE